jgi:UDP:flavonoid glycosyltransferase YjiC (YdhE family)
MDVLLVPFGSHGDVHPFVGLGQALRARGHRVTFLINDYFGGLVRGLGFEMVPLGEADHFATTMRDPDIWHPRRAFSVVAREVLKYTRLTFDGIREMHRTGTTVVVGATLAFGVGLAHEVLGLPTVTAHLQPAVFHSDHETPVYPGLGAACWAPRWFKRPFFDMIYGRFVEPQIAPGLNAIRTELGLPPVRDVMRRWIHAAPLVLGFFPPWFGPPQPDWPQQLRLVGFPLYDERDATPMPAALEGFLAAGPPPIVFTPGSANLHARAFFEAAAEACARLGRRGVFLTRFPEQVPSLLPDAVRHFAYAPFSRLLPRAAALVHHGGVGTAAQGMAAGVPQLVMPLSHDQYDNAARMRRLGVAQALPPGRFRGTAVAASLGGLLGSSTVAACCRDVAGRFAADARALDHACEAIETVARPEAALTAIGRGP